MTEYGLIGHPLKHSFSPAYFAKKFDDESIDAVYDAYDLEDISELSELLAEHPTLRGLNVTIPYKQAVIPYLASISEAAKRIGAVNTVFVDNNGKLYGHNTDYEGFRNAIECFFGGGKVLIAGTGGASLAVVEAVKDLGGIPLRVSRTSGKGDLTYDEITEELLNDVTMVVNTTPLGTWPNVDNAAPLPYHLLSPHQFCIDLVYNPSVTKFMQLCAAQGCAVKNGLDMLHSQAEASWKFWTDNEQRITNNA